MRMPTGPSLSFCFLLLFVFFTSRNGAVDLSKAATGSAAPTTGWQFKSPLAKAYAVPRRLPLMQFDIDPSYAGLIDISQGAKQITKIFFWFIPSANQGSNDLTLWTNGGPGCSSLIGAFLENGMVSWPPGQSSPVLNKYSWHKLTSMLYFEHPAPVGFSEGNVVIGSEAQVADYTFRFLQAFLKIFGEMAGKNFYIAAESYGGVYGPYMAQYIHAHHSQLALHLQGLLLVDPLIADYMYQTDVPIFQYIAQYNTTFGFSTKTMEMLNKTDQNCGFSKYLHDHLTYPATGTLPPLVVPDPEYCSIWSKMANAIDKPFDFYNIMSSSAENPLAGYTPYPDRADVKKALNVYGHQAWTQCVGREGAKFVFPAGDSSDAPVYGVLSSVIEQNKRTIIIHGSWDARLPVQGVQLMLQNVTWGRIQGFKEPIDVDLRFAGKNAGRYRTERGLTFAEIFSSGHMVPRDRPEVAFQIVKYLLGQATNVSS